MIETIILYVAPITIIYVIHRNIRPGHFRGR